MGGMRSTSMPQQHSHQYMPQQQLKVCKLIYRYIHDFKSIFYTLYLIIIIIIIIIVTTTNIILL